MHFNIISFICQGEIVRIGVGIPVDHSPRDIQPTANIPGAFLLLCVDCIWRGSVSDSLVDYFRRAILDKYDQRPPSCPVKSAARKDNNILHRTFVQYEGSPAQFLRRTAADDQRGTHQPNFPISSPCRSQPSRAGPLENISSLVALG